MTFWRSIAKWLNFPHKILSALSKYDLRSGHSAPSHTQAQNCSLKLHIAVGLYVNLGKMGNKCIFEMHSLETSLISSKMVLSYIYIPVLRHGLCSNPIPPSKNKQTNIPTNKQTITISLFNHCFVKACE